MKRIDENQLAARVASLKERMAEIECNQQNEDVMGTLGKYVAPIGSAIKTGAGKAVNAVRNALGTTAGKVAAGGAIGAGALAAGQALMQPGQAAAPTGATSKTPAKSDPAVLKQQQDLIAKGAKIKADGIMGPATQAAIKQFGGTPPAPAPAPAPEPAPAPAPAPAPVVGNQTDANQSAAETNRLNAAGKPPVMTAADREDAEMGAAMRANQIQAGHNAVVASGQGDDSAGLDAAVAAQQAAAPAPAPAPMKGGYGSGANNPSVAAAPAAPVDTTDPLAPNNAQSIGAGKPGETAQAQAAAAAPTAKAPQAKPGETAQAQAAAAPVATESVGFRNDELNRILTLVHHR